jgi:hypothetical protein
MSGGRASADGHGKGASSCRLRQRSRSAGSFGPIGQTSLPRLNDLQQGVPLFPCSAWRPERSPAPAKCRSSLSSLSTHRKQQLHSELVASTTSSSHRVSLHSPSLQDASSSVSSPRIISFDSDRVPRRFRSRRTITLTITCH